MLGLKWNTDKVHQVLQKDIILLAVYLSAVYRVSLCNAVTCPGLGVFNNSSPFEAFPPAECPRKSDITFLLYTDSNESQFVTQENMGRMQHPARPSVFIVHGYRSDVQTASWMHRLKDALLSKGSYNVILVNWKRLAKPGAGFWYKHYKEAASNTRTVNAVLVRYARRLKEAGATYLWCIGHSLGAHTCGHGTNSDLWTRISGLDPAGPLFRHSDPAAGLRPSSAAFVDVIHTYGSDITLTGALVYGLMRPSGHVDFYPNAASRQPGCSPGPWLRRRRAANDTSITGKGILGSICSHTRAYEYFIESVTSEDCSFKTITKCSDSNNIPNSCKDGNETAFMGFHADSSKSGLYILETNEAPPYCKGDRSRALLRLPDTYIFLLTFFTLLMK